MHWFIYIAFRSPDQRTGIQTLNGKGIQMIWSRNRISMNNKASKFRQVNKRYWTSVVHVYKGLEYQSMRCLLTIRALRAFVRLRDSTFTRPKSFLISTAKAMQNRNPKVKKPCENLPFSKKAQSERRKYLWYRLFNKPMITSWPSSFNM